MKGLRLYKKEKLCSPTAIDALFARHGKADGSSALAYPLRAVWRRREERRAECPQFVIIVPKKRVRHAVDRVAVRRRIREAYRLNRDLLEGAGRVDIAFVWVGETTGRYSSIERAMQRLLRRVNPPADECDQ